MSKRLFLIMTIVWTMLFFAGCGTIAVQTACDCDCEYCDCDHDYQENKPHYNDGAYEYDWGY